jgi:hypothetical protein
LADNQQGLGNPVTTVLAIFVWVEYNSADLYSVIFPFCSLLGNGQFTTCSNSLYVCCGEVNRHGNVVIKISNTVKTGPNSKRMVLAQFVSMKNEKNVSFFFVHNVLKDYL